MIPSKSEISLGTITTDDPSNSEKETLGIHVEGKAPSISTRQKPIQSKILPGELNAVETSCQPELVTRQSIKNPEKILIADGVWLRHERKITQLIKELNHSGSAEKYDNSQDKIKSCSESTLFFEFGKSCFNYIKNLEFESDQKKFQFIMSLAKNDPWRCAISFENFLISDQQYIFQIAMACAEHKRFANYFEHFKLDSEANRIEVAHKCCTINPKLFSENIKKFSINDEQANIKLAVHLAKSMPKAASKIIADFNINNEDERKKIAFLCGEKALDNLEDFNLSAESRTKLAFQIINNPYGHELICNYIKILNIENENDRITLAMQCASQEGILLAKNINYFSITDENIRFKLAKKCLVDIMENQTESLPNLANFNIINSEKYKIIIHLILRNLDSDGDWDFVSEFITLSLGKEKAISGLIDAYLTYKSIDADMIFEDGAIDMIEELISSSKNTSFFEAIFLPNNKYLESAIKDNSNLLSDIFGTPLEKIIKKVNSTDEDEEKIANKKWLRDVLFYFNRLKIDKSTVDDIIAPALRDIAKINDKKYRDFLTQNIFSLFPNFPPILEVKKFTSANRLPLLLTWPIFNSAMQEFIQQLPREIIHDGNRQRKLIETICSLKNSGLLPDEVKTILGKIFPENYLKKSEPFNPDGSKPSQRELKLLKINTSDRSDKLEKLKAILTSLSKIRVASSFGEDDINSSINNTKDLEYILKNIASNYFSLSEEDYQKFSFIFYNYRNEMSLLIYLSRIQRLTAASDLTEFVHLVLNDKFLSRRYERSEILNLCEKNLQEAWMHNTVIENSDKSKYLFTDNHEDFINMGIRGSCQNVEGDPSLNRGVIGATMDGSEKLCVLKNASGDILQRCILRLMWEQPASNTKTLVPQGKPCIFMESIYPPNLNAAAKNKLIDFAYMQAKRLNLPLALAERTGSTAYPNLSDHYHLTECRSSLHSGKVMVPYYSDAKGGIQEEAFSINHSAYSKLSWISPHNRPVTH